MMSSPASVIAGREVDRNSNAVDAQRLPDYPSSARARHAPSRVVPPRRIVVEEVAAEDSFRPTSGFATLRPALKSANADIIATRPTPWRPGSAGPHRVEPFSRWSASLSG